MKEVITEIGGTRAYPLSNLDVIIAIAMITCASFFLLQNKQDISYQIAGYAYYLLVVGILWNIFQYLMNKSRHKNEFKALDGQT